MGCINMHGLLYRLHFPSPVWAIFYLRKTNFTVKIRKIGEWIVYLSLFDDKIRSRHNFFISVGQSPRSPSNKNIMNDHPRDAANRQEDDRDDDKTWLNRASQPWRIRGITRRLQAHAPYFAHFFSFVLEKCRASDGE